MHGVAQRPALRDGQRGRLLQVDVLAGTGRGNRDGRVPVVGRADDDRVDVAVGEQFAVVGVPGHAVVRLAAALRVLAVDQHLGVLDAAGVEIADGHDAGLRELPEARHVVTARDAADADGADGDLVARRLRAEHRGRHDAGEACGRGRDHGRCFQEPAPGASTLCVGHRCASAVADRSGGYVFIAGGLRLVCCASSTSCMARKQCACVIAVSVRSRMSLTTCRPYVSSTSVVSTYLVSFWSDRNR